MSRRGEKHSHSIFLFCPAFERATFRKTRPRTTKALEGFGTRVSFACFSVLYKTEKSSVKTRPRTIKALDGFGAHVSFACLSVLYKTEPNQNSPRLSFSSLVLQLTAVLGMLIMMIMMTMLVMSKMMEFCN